jgi:O-succinylbenzoate synthase
MRVGHWGAGSTLLVGVAASSGNPFELGNSVASGLGATLGKLQIGSYDQNNDGEMFGVLAESLPKLKLPLPYEDGDFCIMQM